MSTSEAQKAAGDGRAYHHGDLAEVLLDTALESVARDGVQNLSLRALAREAGVSATAPYRHFPSKRSLLAALATRGYRQLGAQIAQRLQGLTAPDGAGPLQVAKLRLMETGRAYIAFAVANPTTYHLMFGSVIDDFSPYEMLKDASEKAYSVLDEIVEEVRSAGGGAGLSAAQLGGAAWAAVHGIAALMIGDAARGSQLDGVDLSRTGPLQAVLALREGSDVALAALLASLVEGGAV